MRTLTRTEAIEALRERCIAITDDEHSLCQVAARLHILCEGFSQWKFHELKERYDWIASRRPGITRSELEELANRWHLARQFVKDAPLACDVQPGERQHQICRGWEGHTEEDLVRFHKELLGEDVRVVPDDSSARAAP
jgi:hypothetical protein